MISIVFIFTFLLNSVWALPESELSVVYDVLVQKNAPVTWVENSFAGIDNVSITYIKYGVQQGARGSMVLSPGRAEMALHYTEVAYDLVQAGYSPVYVIDHRGQGASGRMLEDGQKGYVERFSDYADDFAHFVETVVLVDKQVNAQKLFVMGHSMGGAILLDYLERYDSPFQAAVFASPMFKIVLEKSEEATLQETWFACFTPFGPKCEDYIPGEGPYKLKPLDPNSTLSPERFAIKDGVYQKWPSTQLGGPTVKWGRESILADREIRKAENVQKISIPFLILQAENDRVVENSGENDVCAVSKLCSLVVVAQAEHGLFYESDAIRNYVMETWFNYLSSW